MWIATPWRDEKLRTEPWLEKHFDDFFLTQSQISAIAVHRKHADIGGQGIYFLLLGEQIVYVGISNQISARVIMHIRDGEKTFDRVAIIQAPEFIAKFMEAIYYEILRPEHNVRPERFYGESHRLLSMARKRL
jgi:hypothetical protein